jgi:hypothetical protein
MPNVPLPVKVRKSAAYRNVDELIPGRRLTAKLVSVVCPKRSRNCGAGRRFIREPAIAADLVKSESFDAGV